MTVGAVTGISIGIGATNERRPTGNAGTKTQIGFQMNADIGGISKKRRFA